MKVSFSVKHCAEKIIKSVFILILLNTIPLAYGVDNKHQQQPKNVVFESSDITKILPYITPDSLVIFDIDNTITHSNSSFGSSEWYTYIVNYEMRKGLTSMQAINKCYPLWIRAQKFNTVVLLDKRIPNLIANLQKSNLTVMAFTARQPMAFETSKRQLKSVEIDFNKNDVRDVKISHTLEFPIFFKDGILLSHDLMEKGSVFLAWFEAFRKQKPAILFKKIIFIDDVEKNIKTMEKASEKLKIPFVGLRYSAGDHFKKTNLKETLAVQELTILLEEPSDQKASQALKKLWLESSKTHPQ